MRLREILVVGLLALLLGLPLYSFRPLPQPGHISWAGPPGTRWAGAELRGMDVWSGRSGVTGNFLELRCVRRPFLKTRLTYWPGPEWRGRAGGQVDKVVYTPGWGKGILPKSLRNPVSIALPWWLSFCPA